MFKPAGIFLLTVPSVASFMDLVFVIYVSRLSLYRGFYMSAHVLLNLFNELGKRDKCEACQAFYLFIATS